MILMLQHRVKQAIKKEQVDDEEFANEFRATWQAMQHLEEKKFQAPRYSEMCSELAASLGEICDMNTPARRKSMMKPRTSSGH